MIEKISVLLYLTVQVKYLNHTQEQQDDSLIEVQKIVKEISDLSKNLKVIE